MNNILETLIENRVQVIAIIGNLIFFYFVINLVRKKRIREEYSLLWIMFSIVFLVFSFWREGLEILASWLGIYYAPMAFLLILILGILSILIHYSVIISGMSEQNKSLVQELGLLKTELQQLKEKMEKAGQ
jgi:hypothetical protein